MFHLLCRLWMKYSLQGEDSYRELVGFGTTGQASSVQCEGSNGEFLPLVIEAVR